MPYPVSWTPKDPDEVVNYQLPWGPQLELGDTVVASQWLDVAGVVKDSDTIAPDALSTYARLSGGVDGTTATLTNRVTTANGETLEQFVSLPIVATNQPPLGPYDPPRPQDLLARYPAFTDVPYDTIAIHLQDAQRGADTTWAEADYGPAIMALAAHNMTLVGLGITSQAQQHIRDGVESLRDGAFSVSFNDKCVQGVTSGGLGSTTYGRIYKTLLRKNKAGPRVVGAAVVPEGWGPLAQQNNGVILP